MRRVDCTITQESCEDMANARRFNPCLEVTFRDRKGIHRHKISAGHGDEVYAFRENGQTFIYSQNTRLGYVGLEMFTGKEKIGDVFFQGGQVEEVLGKDNWEDDAPPKIVKKLVEYIY